MWVLLVGALPMAGLEEVGSTPIRKLRQEPRLFDDKAGEKSWSQRFVCALCFHSLQESVENTAVYWCCGSICVSYCKSHAKVLERS